MQCISPFCPWLIRARSLRKCIDLPLCCNRNPVTRLSFHKGERQKEYRSTLILPHNKVSGFKRIRRLSFFCTLYIILLRFTTIAFHQSPASLRYFSFIYLNERFANSIQFIIHQATEHLLIGVFDYFSFPDMLPPAGG